MNSVDVEVLKKFKNEVLEELKFEVLRFSEGLNSTIQLLGLEEAPACAWGFDSTTGRKMLRLCDMTVSRKYPSLAEKIDKWNEAYQRWTDCYRCEASFILGEKNGKDSFSLFISAINYNVYTSEDGTDFHLKQLMKAAKEEHVN